MHLARVSSKARHACLPAVLKDLVKLKPLEDFVDIKTQRKTNKQTPQEKEKKKKETLANTTTNNVNV